MDRSQRIVMEVSGLDRDEARSCSTAREAASRPRSSWRVGREPRRGRAALEEHAGRLRAIVGDPPPVRQRDRAPDARGRPHVGHLARRDGRRARST